MPHKMLPRPLLFCSEYGRYICNIIIIIIITIIISINIIFTLLKTIRC